MRIFTYATPIRITQVVQRFVTIYRYSESFSYSYFTIGVVTHIGDPYLGSRFVTGVSFYRGYASFLDVVFVYLVVCRFCFCCSCMFDVFWL